MLQQLDIVDITPTLANAPATAGDRSAPTEPAGETALSGLHDGRRKQAPAYLLRQGEGVFGKAGGSF